MGTRDAGHSRPSGIPVNKAPTSQASVKRAPKSLGSKTATERPDNTIASGNPEAFPAKLQPMMAQLAKAPFRDPAWLFEPKLDGYRMLAFRRGADVQLASRRGNAYTRL